VHGIERPTTQAVLGSAAIEYRLDPGDGPVVLIFHGGHMRAGLALGEEAFTRAGYTILAPSRPGYGRTPLSASPSPGAYADTVRALCTRLGIVRIAAVVGISGGGPTAVAMAAKHPDLVERLILISAVGRLPWPDTVSRLGARVVFARGVEAGTWAGVRLLIRRPGQWPLRLMLGSLSALPARQVVAALTPAEQETLRALFCSMRSGRGFRNDLRPGADLSPAVGQPTLVIASRADHGVPFAHAESLVAAIANATLVESRAASHFVWFAPDWPAITEQIRRFLSSPATPTTPTTGPTGPAWPPGPTVPVDPSAPSRSDPPPTFHRPLRRATAGLAGIGVLLAAGTAVPAFMRLGTWSGLTFTAVAVAGTVLAAGVWRGSRWALRTAAAGLAGQPIIALAAACQVCAGLPATKADELHRIGVAPELGAAANLAYSALGTALFVWLAVRWRRTRAGRRPQRR
jgi:pimeloyl-ACP methyl ester carboxylesterase